MSVRIANSLTKKKEELIPQTEGIINMYTCGVTVYDKCHIGHARSLYIFDVIRRYLEYRNFKVNFIRNITDVDDKIIKKALELGVDWKEVVEKNIAFYKEDFKKFGVRVQDDEPRATDNIQDMIEHIRGLIDKGYAYQVGGDVYFSVRKFKNYGKLSGQSIEQMLEAVRIEKDEKKQDPLDFALWKESKEGEPFWESPWGKGRPGWHIECSVMSLKYLKCQTMDIHAGGRDLIFPHHENEIAQAEALTDKTFAKYWIHHGLLTINAQKMAKSLGNFITIEDALKKYDADELKLFFLSSHYASPIDFSESKMEETKKSYERIYILMEKLHRMNLATGGATAEGVWKMKQQFIDSMDDDFNTPKAIAVLFDLISWCNKLIDSDTEGKQFMLCGVMEFIKEIAGIFGLERLRNLSFRMQSDASKEIESKIKLRSEYKKQKEYQKADEVRRDLEAQGIILEDTKDGVVWRRKI